MTHQDAHSEHQWRFNPIHDGGKLWQFRFTSPSFWASGY
jgi:hypothetical protein